MLKRDAVAKVVLNNLYRMTQLQDNFGANMLAIVDGVPRTLTIDQFITHWVRHQVEVIVRRTQFRLNKAEADAHILRGYLKALEALDDVIALIRKSPTVDDAKQGLIDLLTIDDVQAMAILNLQLRRLAALERQKIQDQADELARQIAEFKALLASEELQREIISTELTDVVAKYGDDRRSEIMYGFGGDVSNEDLIQEKYQGIRPAPGYPACPDHSAKLDMFALLQCDEIDMGLTSSLAMTPAASVSGFYLAHPEAKYFNVGRIGDDQVQDLAQRQGVAVKDLERLLAPNL